MIQNWGPKGFCYFEEALWSSSLDQNSLRKIQHFLVLNRFANIDVALAQPIGAQAARTQWQKYYGVDGCCRVRDIKVEIPEFSNHLKLTFAYKSEVERQQNSDRKLVVANAIRLVFGVSVARELVLHSFYSCNDPEHGPFSDTGFASKFDNQTPNIFDDPPIEDARLGNFPPEAAVFLDHAFRQEYPIERFVLMWSALEVITRALPVKGQAGAKRENFFLGLGSSIANEELKRLVDVRHKLFKEGRTNRTAIEENCWSLYAAIQIMALSDGPQRHSFLIGYEDYIRNQRVP